MPESLPTGLGDAIRLIIDNWKIFSIVSGSSLIVGIIVGVWLGSKF